MGYVYMGMVRMNVFWRIMRWVFESKSKRGFDLGKKENKEKEKVITY